MTNPFDVAKLRERSAEYQRMADNKSSTFGWAGALREAAEQFDAQADHLDGGVGLRGALAQFVELILDDEINSRDTAEDWIASVLPIIAAERAAAVAEAVHTEKVRLVAQDMGAIGRMIREAEPVTRWIDDDFAVRGERLVAWPEGWSRRTAEDYARAKGMLPAAPVASAPVSEPDGWRPIETAPKDGKEIILFGPYPEGEGLPKDRVTAGFWCTPEAPVIGDCGGECRCPEYGDAPDPFWSSMHGGSDGGWMSTDGGFTKDWPPTHWRPLPAAPRHDDGRAR